MFELLKKGEILQIPTENPMTEKQAWSAFRDIIHGLEYRKSYFHYLIAEFSYFFEEFSKITIGIHLQNPDSGRWKPPKQPSTYISYIYLVSELCGQEKGILIGM